MNSYDEEREQMQIPTEMLGRIIGKKGAKIQELERNSGCSIKVFAIQCITYVLLLLLY